MKTHAHISALSFCLLIGLSACGSNQLQVTPHRDRIEHEGERVYGTIALTDPETGEMENKVYIKKIGRRGYGLQGRLAEDTDDDFSLDFVAKKDKEFKYFSGVQLSWGF